jgi:hypothetical protein
MQLSTMSSSTPSERAFKSASFHYRAERSQFDETNVEYLVMIRQNISLLMSQPLESLLEMLLKQGIDLDNPITKNTLFHFPLSQPSYQNYCIEIMQ